MELAAKGKNMNIYERWTVKLYKMKEYGAGFCKSKKYEHV